VNDHGEVRFPTIDWAVRRSATERYAFRACDFTSPRGEVEAERRFRRESEGFEASIRTRTVLTCDSESFHLEAELDAFEGGERVFRRRWDRKIPRRLL